MLPLSHAGLSTRNEENPVLLSEDGTSAKVPSPPCLASAAAPNPDLQNKLNSRTCLARSQGWSANVCAWTLSALRERGEGGGESHYDPMWFHTSYIFRNWSWPQGFIT